MPLVRVHVGNTVHSLYHGDCLDIMSKLAGYAGLTCICSPPYNIGKEYNTDADDVSREDYLAWSAKWMGEVKRLVKGGHFFLNMGSKPSSPLGPFQVLSEAIKLGFVLQNHFAWVKSITTTLSQGQFKPLNSGRYVNDLWEPVFHLTETGNVPINRYHPDVAVPHQDQTNVTRWATGRKVRCRGNVLFAPYETVQSREERVGAHPASFPERLVELLLGLATPPPTNDPDAPTTTPIAPTPTVLDPFAGSLTTAVVAVHKGWNSVMIEEDETYFLAGVARVVEAAKAVGEPQVTMSVADTVWPP